MEEKTRKLNYSQNVRGHHHKRLQEPHVTCFLYQKYNDVAGGLWKRIRLLIELLPTRNGFKFEDNWDNDYLFDPKVRSRADVSPGTG
jgi:hypothetical protein